MKTVKIEMALKPKMHYSKSYRVMLVSEYFLTGNMNLHDIAEKLTSLGFEGVTASIVYGDLRALKVLWQEKAVANISVIIQKELLKLDLLEQHLHENIQNDPENKHNYVNQFLNIMDRRSKFLGLDKAKRVELSSPGGQPLGSIKRLSDEELEIIATGNKKTIQAEDSGAPLAIPGIEAGENPLGEKFEMIEEPSA